MGVVVTSRGDNESGSGPFVVMVENRGAYGDKGEIVVVAIFVAVPGG